MMDTIAQAFLSSNLVLMVSMCVVFAVLVFFSEFILSAGAKIDATKKKSKNHTLSEKLRRPPGPKPYPIIGNLTCFNGYEIPYQAFDALAQKYGPIIGLRFGSVPCVVVNGINNIKDVLITNSSHFGNRPNFRRYHILFRGNKEECKYIFFRCSFSCYTYKYIYFNNSCLQHWHSEIGQMFTKYNVKYWINMQCHVNVPLNIDI